MSSTEICDIMKAGIAKHFPTAEVIAIPVADGGEGTVQCFLDAVGGELVSTKAQDPFHVEMDAFYGLIDHGKTAIVEMAACAGLPLVEGRANPSITTTYGVGQLIKHAINNGVQKIVVGLGGSCTNDAGCGAAAAIGVKFFNTSGAEFIPTGGTLINVAKIDASGANPGGAEIIAMCDIDNPMYGDTGAAAVFAPQKGATPEMVEKLDAGVKHLASVIKRDLGLELDNLPGTGAAGAMGAGMIAFFGARLQMGIETVLDTVCFDEKIKNADFIFTGEGKIDTQSLRGKVVVGVARRAKLSSVPVIAFVGDIGDDIEGVYDEGVSSIISINRVAKDFAEVKHRAKSDLALTVDNFLRFIAVND